MKGKIGRAPWRGSSGAWLVAAVIPLLAAQNAHGATPLIELRDAANVKFSGDPQTNGSPFNGSAGFSVAPAGDVNGDGVDDVIVGAPELNSNGPPNSAGSAYVIFGGSGLRDLDLSALGNSGFRIDGELGGGKLGYSVSGAGDFNSDGLDDVILAAPSMPRPNGADGHGAAYVIFGSRSPANVALGNLGVAGVKFQADGGLTAVAGAGDVNSDGIDDVIVGASHDGTGAGEADVIYGTRTPGNLDLRTLTASTGFTISPGPNNGWLGSAVARAGDVNGDGVADIIVGAPYSSPGGDLEDAGAAYVIYGSKAPSNIDLGNLGSKGAEFLGAGTYDIAGFSVAGAGDMNGDGVSDVIIGARDASERKLNEGTAYVLFGGSGFGNVDLANLGTAGIAIYGPDGWDQAGVSVSGAGDINQDGVDDVVVGTRASSTPFSGFPGSDFVVYGTHAPTNIDLASMGSSGFQVHGAEGVDRTGEAVAAAGDVNNDGRADLLSGAYGAANEVGAAYIPAVIAPANDNFANAQLLAGAQASAVTQTDFATRQPGEPTLLGSVGGASAWYRWTAPGDGVATINLCQSDFDTVLGVFTGMSLDSLTSIAGNHDGCAAGGPSTATFSVLGGTTYRIAVDGYRPSLDAPPPPTGIVRLQLTFTPSAMPDSTPPDTTITRVAVNSAKAKVRVKFEGIDPAPSSVPISFECRMDHKAWTGCTSPARFGHLGSGLHRFKVRAVDAAGNVDPDRAVARFRIN